MASPDKIIQTLKDKFPKKLLGTRVWRSEATVTLEPGLLVDVCRFLKADPQMRFNILRDLTAVDYETFWNGTSGRASLTAFGSPLPPEAHTRPAEDEGGWSTEAGKRWRFEVVYHLFSLPKKHRVRLKVPLPRRNPSVPTLAGVWLSANWYEREVWDMFGIHFEGHPDLKRLLMYEEFEGHPLRKDYPYDRRQPLIGPQN
ncbi:MAG: NADH-quinone oxidoreductase subunit C [Candidatus Omnitrophica bacterium]|nr:NADH-quinone oxidoreductase subunit C [Candidatus Omnitrophota bacterium]